MSEILKPKDYEINLEEATPSIVRGKYQLFPDLSPEEEMVLRTSIKENGVLCPIVKDEQDNTIDGHQCQRIANELGIPYREIVRHFNSEQEKYEYALNCNSARRRHLSQSQKRQVIAAYLRGDPEISDNWLGQILGVSPTTIQDERRNLETTSQIETLPYRRGKDNKRRPSKVAHCTPRVANEDDTAADDISSSDLQIVGEEDSKSITNQGILTTDEIESLQIYVESVGNWDRAFFVLKEGYKLWTQNQNG